MKILGPLVIAAVLFSSANIVRADNPVVVHEWGTFTSLQDENGQAIGGLNVDDEPVPPFVYDSGYVHRLGGVAAGQSFYGLPPYFPTKGWRPADQDVTMRLETPVLYFYPPKGDAGATALPLTVHVDFHDGVLSQFYPYAEKNGFPPDFPYNQQVQLASLTSGLTWTVTHFGSSQKPVETTDKVWTTPREVSAPEIEVKAKQFDNDSNKWIDAPQAEHFLFYRGVGHLDSPLRLQDGDSALGVWPQKSPDNVTYADAWLADIRGDGSCAFRESPPLGPVTQTRPEPLAVISEKFAPWEFKAGNLAQLRTSMQAALVKEGLYPDEASAMLRTWELSYFKSPGLRFFYIVPRTWVDNTLPLKITGAPVEITRVIVGRIELISDEQKATLARLASEPAPDLNALKLAVGDAIAKGHYSKQEQNDFASGARPLSDLGLTISPSVRDYLSLGRFRDALLVHEQQEHPSDKLARFVRENGLAAR